MIFLKLNYYLVRMMELRKGVNLQSVAIVLMAFLVTVMTPFINAQEVKPIIIEALNRGDTATAISLLESEISLDKTYYMNYYTLGLVYYNQGKYHEACQYCDHRIGYRNGSGCADDGGFFRQVRPVGHNSAHTDTQSKERLAHSRKHAVPGQFVKVGREHE